MSDRGSPHTIEAWGDFACFTSPMKVERWSYPFITPSAARGIFDAIFVNRHEFRWQIDCIELLAEPNYIALMRNEVKEKGPSEGEITNWMSDISKVRPILADADEQTSGSKSKGRTQRQTMALRDVRYRITAHVEIWPGAPKHCAAYDGQFMRRLARGQHFVQPCFGCREFPAWWGPADCNKPAWAGDLDAGWMLYDVFDLSRRGQATDAARVSLFHAKVRAGVLDVPHFTSDLVKKGARR